jgi:hypothetical protein
LILDATKKSMILAYESIRYEAARVQLATSAKLLEDATRDREDRVAELAEVRTGSTTLETKLAEVRVFITPYSYNLENHSQIRIRRC